MNRTTWLSMVLALASPLAASAVAADDGSTPPANPPQTPPAQSKDAAAAQYIKELKPQMDKQADQDAKASMKKLIEFWKDKEVTDATKKEIPNLLEQYGRKDKTPIAIEAIDQIAELGAAAGAPQALAILERALKAKEPALDIYGSCLRTLKKLADTRPATLKVLQDLLKHRMADIVGKSADAMAGYKDAPGKVRRELLEELIKATEGTYSQSKSAKAADQVAKWNTIQSYVISALKALSGQPLTDPEAARKWFNEHKKDKSWDS